MPEEAKLTESELAALRAQLYPEIIDDNGLPWYMNKIERPRHDWRNYVWSGSWIPVGATAAYEDIVRRCSRCGTVYSDAAFNTECQVDAIPVR